MLVVKNEGEVQTMKISREFVIKTWTKRGINDFYISFELNRKWPKYATFFCCQGLEKICKAYLLAERANEYENKIEQDALKEVNKIAKSFSHRLKDLIGKLSSKNQ